MDSIHVHVHTGSSGIFDVPDQRKPRGSTALIICKGYLTCSCNDYNRKSWAGRVMMIFIDVSVVICWNIKPYRRTLCWTYYTLFVLLERSRLRPASTSGAMLSSRTGFYVLVTLATTLCFWRSSAQTLVETDGELNEFMTKANAAASSMLR